MSEKIYIKCKLLSPDAKVPSYQTIGASGMDLYSVDTLDIGINKIAIVGTGVAVAIPEGYEGQIRARSGLATRGLAVVNAPGTIDADYRGEIKVILINLGEEVIHIEKGDRIAQLVIVPVVRVGLIQVQNLDATVRANNGFGSTGRR